ncbi:hypothetical protein [Paraburkholderia sp. J10-1]|uniref:hypothetical protein n=1 Tax=Paraburkholderia sp. J10-1 TaxID=2805430 RepID=UPI002AB79A9C|nr:hypothetical protein [Paraburkholderia sp. J10-1]
MNAPHAIETGHITLLWVTVNSVRSPVFRDRKCRLLIEATDYCRSIAKKKQDEAASNIAINSELGAATYAAREYLTFSAIVKIRLEASSDEAILAFREWALRRTCMRPQYRGNETIAKRTVNVKLRHIYAFLTWCQANGRIPEGTIGPGKGYRVHSTLPICDTTLLELDQSEAKKYPKLYTRVGQGSRNRTRQHRASDLELERIDQYITEARVSFLAAQRDSLILRIADETAFRCGSINSLTKAHFSDKLLAQAEEREAPAFDVSPVQKFGYVDAFSLSWELTREIVRYIASDRQEIMDQHRADEKRAEGRIFLSVTTGRPLSDNYLSGLFGRYFTAVGAPKGSGLHSVRGATATRTIKSEIELRLREGRSLDRVDILDAGASKLGHHSLTAQQYYVEASAMSRLFSVEAVLQNRLAAAQSEIARLRAELALKKRRST